MICKLKECGTAFSRRLAIQFSKTEPIPSNREASLEPSLAASESRGQPAASRRAAYLPAPSEFVKRKFRTAVRRTSRREGDRIYFGLSPPSTLFVEPNRFDSGHSEEGHRFYSGFPSPSTPRFDFRRPRGCARGPASTPLAGAPSSGVFSFRKNRPRRRRALLLPPWPEQVKREKEEPEAGEREAPRPQRSQASSARFPRRQRSAIGAASGAGAPPLRARSCAAIAERHASACARTSLTTKYP